MILSKDFKSWLIKICLVSLRISKLIIKTIINNKSPKYSNKSSLSCNWHKTLRILCWWGLPSSGLKINSSLNNLRHSLRIDTSKVLICKTKWFKLIRLKIILMLQGLSLLRLRDLDHAALIQSSLITKIWQLKFQTFLIDRRLIFWAKKARR